MPRHAEPLSYCWYCESHPRLAKFKVEGGVHEADDGAVVTSHTYVCAECVPEAKKSVGPNPTVRKIKY